MRALVGDGRVSEDAAREALLDLVLDDLAERIAARVEIAQPAESRPWRLLSAADVADRLRRSERWVRERTRRGELPCVRLDGGGPGYLEADLIVFAEAHRVAPEQAWWRP